MERDDSVGDLYDAAEDRAYDDYRQRQDDEREEMLEAALDDALNKGVEIEHLRTLARETGALNWSLKHSLRKE